MGAMAVPREEQSPMTTGRRGGGKERVAKVEVNDIGPHVCSLVRTMGWGTTGYQASRVKRRGNQQGGTRWGGRGKETGGCVEITLESTNYSRRMDDRTEKINTRGIQAAGKKPL